MTQEQEETQKGEIFTRKGKAELIPEEENITDITTEEATKDKEVFQETWDLCQEEEVIPQMKEIEEQKEEDLRKEGVLQKTEIDKTHA